MVTAFKRGSGFDKGIIGPALAQIGPPAVPALIELSKDRNEYTRWEAVRAIRIVGAGAGAAEARLNELLSDKASIRVEAAFALWKIRPRPTVIDVYARALEDPDEFARSNAAYYLAEFGPDAAPALPGLIRASPTAAGPFVVEPQVRSARSGREPRSPSPRCCGLLPILGNGPASTRPSSGSARKQSPR